MRQKVFSIIALLLMAVTGAWAQKRGGINDDASVAKPRIMTMAPRRASAIPTNATILYQQNFDDTNDINELGWTFVDNDGDGHNWTMSINGKYDYDDHDFPSETCTSVPNSLYSQSFTDNGYSAFNADNWAITPAIEIYESSILSFQLAYGNPDYRDKVGVYVGETANVNEMTEVLAPTSFSRTAKRQFNEETVDLSAFAGKTCYIAFRHQDYDNYVVFIDDVTVYTISHDLTLADGSDDHGTVAFTVGGNAATRAKKDDVVTYVVQVNGKLRDRVDLPASVSDEEAKAEVLARPAVIAALDGKEPKKIIIVPKKLINIVK